jgi:uncharacterized membrane protein
MSNFTQSTTMYILIGVLLVIVILYSVVFNRYTSSPGFTTQERAEEFYANNPTCYGLSILTNSGAMVADAPGKSICFGYLAR